MNIYDSMTINNRVEYLAEKITNPDVTDFFGKYNILFYGGVNKYGDFEWINESNKSEYTRIDVQGFFEQLIVLSTKLGYKQKGESEWVT